MTSSQVSSVVRVALGLALSASALLQSVSAQADSFQPRVFAKVPAPGEIYEDNRTPVERYQAGYNFTGAISVTNPAYCSLVAAKRAVGTTNFYPDNYILSIDKTTKQTRTVGAFGHDIENIVADAIFGLQMSGDRTMARRHACVGFLNYGQMNAFSYPDGYMIFDPRIIFILQNQNGGKDAMQFVVLHEFAHQLQFWNNDPFMRDTTSRRSELAADCAAGAMTALATLYPGNRTGVQASEIDAKFNDYERAVIFLGDTQFESQGHHGTPIERRYMFRAGLNMVKGRYMLLGSTIGFNSQEALRRCDQLIVERDAMYGDNWPNID